MGALLARACHSPYARPPSPLLYPPSQPADTAFQLAASIVGEAVALKEIMAFFKVQQEGLATQCAASPAVSARVASSMGPASPPPGASAHQWAEALGSLPTGVGSQVRAPGPDAGRWTSSTPPSGTAAGGRPTVGAIVRLAKDTVNTRGGCLGAKAEGKTGEIVRDDHDHKPFRVRCGLQEHWYHEDEVEAAAAPGGDQRPAVGDTVALSAGALPFLLAIDDNSTSWAARALGLPGCGRPGIVKVDDHCDLRQGATSRPFKVAAMVNGSETMDWYPLGALAVRSRAAPFTPLARLPVGALVRSAASAGDARCLGASGSGLVGRLEVDDGTGRPFCVQLLDGSAYHCASPPSPALLPPQHCPLALTLSPLQRPLSSFPGYRESEIVADRPTVGATVRLAKDTDSTRGKCLGDMAEGKSGEIMRDDHDSQPFLVRGGVGGEQHWYREDELIELSAPSIPFRRPAVGDTVALSAAAQVIMSASGVRDDYWRDGALGLHGQGKTGVVIRDDECDKSARSGFPLPFAVASSTGGSSTWYPLGALVVRRAPHLLVGSLVRAAVATSRCLGAPGCGRIGKIEADDASNNPYLVRLLDGSDSDCQWRPRRPCCSCFPLITPLPSPLPPPQGTRMASLRLPPGRPAAAPLWATPWRSPGTLSTRAGAAWAPRPRARRGCSSETTGTATPSRCGAGTRSPFTGRARWRQWRLRCTLWASTAFLCAARAT